MSPSPLDRKLISCGGRAYPLANGSSLEEYGGLALLVIHAHERPLEIDHLPIDVGLQRRARSRVLQMSRMRERRGMADGWRVGA